MLACNPYTGRLTMECVQRLDVRKNDISDLRAQVAAAEIFLIREMH